MPEKNPETLTRWYDVLSSGYDELYGKEQATKHSMVLELLEGMRFEILVDVGCGTGKLLDLASARTEAAVGLDLSSQMLNLAKKRTKNTSVHLVQASASHLPLRNGIASAVTAVSMTESDGALEEHIHELSRIATPAGPIVLTIFDAMSQTSPTRFKQLGLRHVASFTDRESLYVLEPRSRPGMVSGSRL